MSSPNQLSFLPDDYLEIKRQRRTNFICAMLFLAIMVAMGFAFTTVEKSLRTVEGQHAEVDKQYADAAKRIEQVKQMQEKQRKMAHQAELTASLLEKVPRSFLLAEITNAMPGGVSLLDVSLESRVKQPGVAAGGKTQFEMKRATQEAPATAKGATPVAQARQYDVSMKITGIADNNVQVAQFMSKLNNSKLLKEVNLIISDEYVFNESKMRKFQVETTLDPSAEIQAGATPKSGIKTAELK